MSTTYPIPVVTSLKNIQPGKAIKMMYTASLGTYGTFSLNVPDDANELQASAEILSQPNGYFYFICVGYNTDGRLKLIADRPIQTNISWDTLSNAGLCTIDGKTISLDNKKYKDNCTVRIPLSSVDRTDEDHFTEWDTIIEHLLEQWGTNDLDFWELQGDYYSWALNTPITNMSYRVTRSADIPNDAQTKSSTYSDTDLSFRPILIIPDLMDTTPSATGTTHPLCGLEISEFAALAKPGQAVPCRYTVTTANTVGTFSELGTSVMSVIPDRPGATLDGTFYFVCVGYEPSGALKFVADRVIQSGVSWETLNNAGLCTYSGMDVSKLTGIDNSILRLMSSSVVTNSQSHLSSEWDAIIYRDTVGNTDIPISKINNWNYSKTKSWMLETPSITDDLGNASNMSYRIVRGQEDSGYGAVVKRSSDSSFTSEQIGFRPVLSVPINQQTLVFTKEIVTSPRTSKYDIELHHEFMFVDEEATLETTTFEYYVINATGAVPVFNDPITVNKFSITKTVPFSMLTPGENTIRIIATCANKRKILNYMVYKEMPGDTSRTRNYPYYAGGYDIGTSLTIASDKVSSKISSVDLDNATQVDLPKNLTAIHIIES